MIGTIIIISIIWGMPILKWWAGEHSKEGVKISEPLSVSLYFTVLFTFGYLFIN